MGYKVVPVDSLAVHFRTVSQGFPWGAQALSGPTAVFLKLLVVFGQGAGLSGPAHDVSLRPVWAAVAPGGMHLSQ